MLNPDDVNAELELIAFNALGVRTLTPQGRDSLDFHDVSVESMRTALEAAYNLGRSQVAP